jgi:omega-amidase
VKPLRVALLQLDVLDGDPDANLARARTLMAAATPADLWLLPELWTTGYVHARWADLARHSTPEICRELTALARERQAWIGGSLVSETPRGLVNRFWLFPPDGRPATTYDKVHLFGPMEEPAHLTAGTTRVTADVDGWRAGLSVCYDLRFPEMYRLDAVGGAILFLVVAEWPAARAATMRLLAQARAVENQAFLALCNRVGTASDGTVFGGGSLIVAPDGSVLGEGGATEEIVTAVLKAHRVEALRGSLPVLSGRVPGVDTPPVVGMETAPTRRGRSAS